MTELNNVSIKIYSNGTSLINDVNNDFLYPSGIWYETCYPGGKFLAGGCNIVRIPTLWWEINEPLRVVVLNGQTVVYEGKINDFQHQYSSSDMGVSLNFMGLWGWDMLNRTIRKRWADDRVDDQTWKWDNTALAADICTIKRDGRFRFLPKAEAWAANDFATVEYELKGTGTIQRVVYDYDLQEAAQSWEVYLARSTNGVAWTRMSNSSGETYNTGTTTIITSSGTGSIDVEPTGSPTWIRFVFVARAGQTPTSDGTYYANITNLMVYTEDEGATGINLDSVAADIAASETDILNSDTTYLDASDNVRKVEPLITNGDNYENIGDVLFRVAGFGNSNDEPYAVGVLASDKAATPDGKPVLYTQELPDVTAGYDYFLSLDDPNIVSGITITRDYGRIVNEVRVTYRDQEGKQQIVTSADDASLADNTSQTAYGRRDISLSIGNSEEANAVNYGARYIQKYKDPPWIINGSITVFWALEGDGGEAFPASRVEAGKRIKIDSYDTFIVSRTRYDADSQSVQISIGTPDDLIFTESEWEQTWDDSIDEGGGSGGAGASGGGGLGHSIGILTGNEKLRKQLNRSGRGEKWQHFKKFVQRYRREGKGNFKAGMKEYKKKYGKVGV